MAGGIDSYVEYTGTALTAILKQPLAKDPDEQCWPQSRVCIGSATT